jgi:hypothetical protein
MTTWQPTHDGEITVTDENQPRNVRAGRFRPVERERAPRCRAVFRGPSLARAPALFVLGISCTISCTSGPGMETMRAEADSGSEDTATVGGTSGPMEGTSRPDNAPPEGAGAARDLPGAVDEAPSVGVSGGPETEAPGSGELPFVELPPTAITELVRAYEASEISLSTFTAASLSALADAVPSDLPAVLEGVTLLTREAPYEARADVQVPDGSVLLLQPGATLVLGPGVELSVEGQLYALGGDEAPASITGRSAADAFGTVRLAGGRSELHSCVVKYGRVLLSAEGTGAARIEVDGCRLDSWVGEEPLALSFADADGLFVHDSWIGVDTPDEEIQGEAAHGESSAARLVGNVFGKRLGYLDVLDLGPCEGEHVPRILSNEFLGGEDDGIDLDGCKGIIAGNYVHDFVGGAGGANGGGLTGGANSEVLVVNNVIENVVHAIGYKDDVRALLLNNTIVDSDEGFRPEGNARVEAVGNVFWGNEVDSSGDAAGYLTADFNLFSIPGFTGENGNLGSDPQFVEDGGLPYGLGPSSPALGHSYGDPDALASRTSFGREVIEEFLSVDFFGRPRALPALDLGAVSRAR